MVAFFLFLAYFCCELKRIQMKEKILAQLKQKFTGVSTVLLGLYADSIAAKITTETEIEGAISELENLPISIPDQNKFYQTEGDRRAAEAAITREANLKQQFNFVDKSGTPPTPPANPKPTDEILSLKARLDEFEKNQKRAVYLQKAQSMLTEKNIPKSFYSKVLEKMEFENDETIEAAVNEINTDFTSFKQSMVDEGLLLIEKPMFGESTSTGVSPAMQKFIELQSADQTNPLGAKKL
jgi:hypothetical protein